MNILGYLIWIVAIAIALVPLIGLIAEFLEWYKYKSIREYERGKDGDKE